MSPCNTHKSSTVDYDNFIWSEWQIDLLKYHSFPSLYDDTLYDRQTMMMTRIVFVFGIRERWNGNNNNNLLVFNLCSTHFEYKLKNYCLWVTTYGFLYVIHTPENKKKHSILHSWLPYDNVSSEFLLFCYFFCFFNIFNDNKWIWILHTLYHHCYSVWRRTMLFQRSEYDEEIYAGQISQQSNRKRRIAE